MSIIDKDKFKEEIMNASPATQELKMRNHLKHTIRVGLEKNPDFYKPLAQRLEELLRLKEAQRMDHAALIKAYAGLNDAVIHEHQEAAEKGFATERSRAIYYTMKALFEHDADAAADATQTLFDLIQGELNMVDWDKRSRVMNDIEKKTGRYLRSLKMKRAKAKAKAKQMLELLIKNPDA